MIVARESELKSEGSRAAPELSMKKAFVVGTTPQNGACYHFSKPGHFKRDCPELGFPREVQLDLNGRSKKREFRFNHVFGNQSHYPKFYFTLMATGKKAKGWSEA